LPNPNQLSPPVPAVRRFFDFSVDLGPNGATKWAKYGVCGTTADRQYPPTVQSVSGHVGCRTVADRTRRRKGGANSMAVIFRAAQCVAFVLLLAGGWAGEAAAPPPCPQKARSR
jgi:hypothetical protein